MMTGKGGRYESFANELLSEISGASGRFMPRRDSRIDVEHLAGDAARQVRQQYTALSPTSSIVTVRRIGALYRSTSADKGMAMPGKPGS